MAQYIYEWLERKNCRVMELWTRPGVAPAPTISVTQWFKQVPMADTFSSAPYEDKEIRCPRLGGQVLFQYCNREAMGNPCQKAIFCWSGYFDVETFFREKLSDEAFQECFFRPIQPKVVTLIELIEKARSTLKEE